jgi:hypothetical protein
MQSVKGMLHAFQAMISPANIKLKIAEMQQMSFPELVIGFFKLFFYIFYYSGFGVATVLKWAISLIALYTFTLIIDPDTSLECWCLWCVDPKLRSRWLSPKRKKKWAKNGYLQKRKNHRDKLRSQMHRRMSKEYSLLYFIKWFIFDIAVLLPVTEVKSQRPRLVPKAKARLRQRKAAKSKKLRVENRAPCPLQTFLGKTLFERFAWVSSNL